MSYFNIIIVTKNKTLVCGKNHVVVYKGKYRNYLEGLCNACGSNFNGFNQLSRKLLPKMRKTPIYLPIINDIIFPLGNNKDIVIWLSKANYLTCNQVDGLYYIKFKDKSYININYSVYTVQMQYSKCLILEEKINELKKLTV